MLRATYLGSGNPAGDRLGASERGIADYPESAASSSSSFNQDPDDHNELLWQGKTVIWSQESQTIRKYTFEHEDVAFALFASFAKKRQDSGKGKAVDLSHSETFGPFHQPPSSKWGIPRPVSSSQSTGSSSTSPIAPQRAVIIFLDTQAKVYSPSGSEYTIHLPFRVEKAWALPGGGVLVQRALEKREKRAMKRSKSFLEGMNGNRSVLDDLFDLEDQPLNTPRLFTLHGEMEEFKPVEEGSVRMEEEGIRLLRSDSVPPTTTVVFSMMEPPITLLYNGNTKQISFCRRHLIPIQTVPDPPAITPRTLRPSELLAEHPPETFSHPSKSRPSLHRNPSNFSTTDRRVLGAVTGPDPLARAQRRAPRLSRAIESGEGPGELQKTLDPQPVPSTMNRKGRRSVTRPRESAPSSVMREDIGMALNRAKEMDLRETTMLMGLEREDSGRSEIVLESFGTWDTPE